MLAFVVDGASSETRIVAFVAAAGVIALLLTTVFCFFRAYGDKTWSAGPTTERLISVAQEYPDDVVREWLARELMESVDENANQLTEKALWSERTLRAAVVEATVVTIGIVAVALSTVA